MIYSQSHKFIFIAIDKTGCSSISTLLRPYSTMHKNFIYARSRLKLLGPLTRPFGIYNQMVFPVHASASQAKLYFPRREWESMFKFSFVRHPLDRITSRYEFLVKKKRIPNNETFSKYLESILLGRKRFKHQYTYILDRNRRQLVGWWGKIERIEQDCEVLSTKLNISLPKPPRINVSKDPGKNFRDYFTPSEKSAAEDFCRYDIELFKYQ
ncbi:MAG: hypothetical protein RLZZ263_1542 [Cyanobacteriota bacterium]